MELSRRRFLKVAGAAGVLPSALTFAAQPESGVAGTQLYGWGQYYQKEGKKLSEHIPEALSAVRDCGYEYAETSLDMAKPEANAKFAAQLKAKELRPVALYTGARLHEKEAGEKAIEAILPAAKIAAESGFSVINCNPDPIGRAKSEAELETQARNLDQLGAELKKIGLKLGIHNHTPAMQDKAREFHHNLDSTDPKLVGLCYDVHWVFRGGLPPQEVLPKYCDRVVSWHLRQSRNGIWWEDLAPGDIDYEWVAKYVAKHSLARVFSVELAIEAGTKITRSVVENHRRSRKFVKEVFGV